MTRLPDYPTTDGLPGSRQLPAGFQLAGRPIGKLTGVQIHLNLTAAEMAADELLRERIFDVPLNRTPQRPRAIRAVLARDFDDPVHDFRRQRDAELSIDKISVQLRDEQAHDPPQIVVGQRLEDDDLVDAVDEL